MFKKLGYGFSLGIIFGIASLIGGLLFIDVSANAESGGVALTPIGAGENPWIIRTKKDRDVRAFEMDLKCKVDASRIFRTNEWVETGKKLFRQACLIGWAPTRKHFEQSKVTGGKIIYKPIPEGYGGKKRLVFTIAIPKENSTGRFNIAEKNTNKRYKSSINYYPMKFSYVYTDTEENFYYGYWCYMEAARFPGEKPAQIAERIGYPDANKNGAWILSFVKKENEAEACVFGDASASGGRRGSLPDPPVVDEIKKAKKNQRKAAEERRTPANKQTARPPAGAITVDFDNGGNGEIRAFDRSNGQIIWNDYLSGGEATIPKNIVKNNPIIHIRWSDWKNSSDTVYPMEHIQRQARNGVARMQATEGDGLLFEEYEFTMNAPKGTTCWVSQLANGEAISVANVDNKGKSWKIWGWVNSKTTHRLSCRTPQGELKEGLARFTSLFRLSKDVSFFEVGGERLQVASFTILDLNTRKEIGDKSAIFLLPPPKNGDVFNAYSAPDKRKRTYSWWAQGKLTSTYMLFCVKNGQRYYLDHISDINDLKGKTFNIKKPEQGSELVYISDPNAPADANLVSLQMKQGEAWVDMPGENVKRREAKLYGPITLHRGDERLFHFIDLNNKYTQTNAFSFENFQPQNSGQTRIVKINGKIEWTPDIPLLIFAFLNTSAFKTVMSEAVGSDSARYMDAIMPLMDTYIENSEYFKYVLLDGNSDLRWEYDTSSQFRKRKLEEAISEIMQSKVEETTVEQFIAKFLKKKNLGIRKGLEIHLVIVMSPPSIDKVDQHNISLYFDDISKKYEANAHGVVLMHPSFSLPSDKGSDKTSSMDNQVFFRVLSKDELLQAGGKGWDKIKNLLGGALGQISSGGAN